jgi:hypothetical protein
MKKSKFTEEQIAFALRQAETGTPVKEVIRKLGITETTFYRWKRRYVDASGEAFVCGTDSVYHVDPVSRDRTFVATPTLGTGTPLSSAVDLALPAQPTASSVPALGGYGLAVLAALLLAVALAISRARVA